MKFFGGGCLTRYKPVSFAGDHCPNPGIIKQKLYHCGKWIIQQILCDQLRWQRFPFSESYFLVFLVSLLQNVLTQLS